MVYWTVGLLAVDMALMGGILYILLNKKKSVASPFLDADHVERPSATSYRELIDKAREELSSAKRLAIELDRKRLLLVGYEEALTKKEKEIETLGRKVGVKYASTGLLPKKRVACDVSRKAMKMVNKEARLDEETDMIRLLNGSA